MYSKDSHSQAKLKKESSFTVPQDGEQVGEEE